MSKVQAPLNHRIIDFLHLAERFEEVFDRADDIGGRASERVTRQWAGKLSAAFPEGAIPFEERRKAGVPLKVHWQIPDHAWRTIGVMRSRYKKAFKYTPYYKEVFG
jgi:hypothetical protein